jgi:hypothetical protein
LYGLYRETVPYRISCSDQIVSVPYPYRIHRNLGIDGGELGRPLARNADFFLARRLDQYRRKQRCGLAGIVMGRLTIEWLDLARAPGALDSI